MSFFFVESDSKSSFRKSSRNSESRPTDFRRRVLAMREFKKPTVAPKKHLPWPESISAVWLKYLLNKTKGFPDLLGASVRPLSGVRVWLKGGSKSHFALFINTGFWTEAGRRRWGTEALIKKKCSEFLPCTNVDIFNFINFYGWIDLRILK